MKWKPIIKAPQTGELIDVWAGGERVTDTRWMTMPQGTGWYCWAVNEHGINRLILVNRAHGEPTHWMPIPPPPP